MVRPLDVNDSSTTWWVQRRVVRRWVVPLLLVYTAIVLVLTVWDAFDGGTDLIWTAIGSLLLSTAATLWARSHTRVSSEGIEIVEVRRRNYPWSEISAVRGAPTGGYSIKVKIELVSGRAVTLPGVDPKDRDEVVRFQPHPPPEGGPSD